MKPDSESTATVVPLRPVRRVSSDARLARLAAGGDRAAFAAIFDRYHQDLYRYCVSLLHHSDDAADALQSTMLHALRSLEGDDRDIALRPWLYRIAHNECVSLLRRRRESELNGADTSAAVLDVEGSVAVRAQLQMVLEDIRSLPDRQRAALVMRELAGLGYGEIAAALVTSPAGAKQAVYDARRALLDLSKGRDETCDSIQLRISSGDRRVSRARSVRAHLRACTECRMFALQISEREQALAGLAPVLPAAVAAHVLKGALVGAGGAEGVMVGASATFVGQAVATAAVTVALGVGVAGIELAERGDARGDSAARGPSPAVAPGRAHATHRRAEKQPGATASKSRAGSSARRTPGGNGARPSRGSRAARSDYKHRSAWEPPIDRGASTVAAPVQSASPSPRHRGGRLGLRPGGGGGSGDGRGPIGTTVDNVRGGVRETVNEAVDAVAGDLPIKKPKLPIRERRRR